VLEEPSAIPRRSLLSLDKALCNDRETKERLAHDYRGLVTSIALGYQGKGLSLQDLIQVPVYFSISLFVTFLHNTGNSIVILSFM